MSKIYTRVDQGTKPYKIELFDTAGNNIETRNNSNKDQEVFNYNGYGYSVKITDAVGKFKVDSIDSVSHQLLQKPSLMKSVYYYSTATEASGVINDTLNIPGFNTAGIQAHAYLWMYTKELYNHSRWDQIYDHTIPNQTFTEDQDKHSMDRVIYNAYNTGTNIQNRINLRITFNGSLLESQLDSSWAYGYEDLPRKADGDYADKRPSYTYLVKFPSYASERALNYFKTTFKKFCYRYQKAINDGTIREIAFQLNESGESNMTGGYYDSNGNYSFSYGDYCVDARQKFLDFCIARFNNIETFNQKMGSNIPSFTLSAFNSNMLLNNADGGNNTVKSFWQWYQMELHDLFEYQVQKYAYDNVALTRTRLFAYDVGSIFNGDMFRMKSFNFRQRLLKNPSKWMLVKTNNSQEGGAGPFVIDQAIGAARLVGALAGWEPSPNFLYFTVDFMTEAALLCKNNGVCLSAFSANRANIPEGLDAVPFWQRVAEKANLAAYKDTFQPDSLDSNNNIVKVTLPYLSVALNGYDDHTGDYHVHQAWKIVKDANPNKTVAVYIDDSDLRNLFVNPYPIMN